MSVIKNVLTYFCAGVHGPGPPGPDARSVVVGGFFQPHYGEVCNENLLRQIEGRGPWSGFRWPLMFAVAVVAELAFVSNRVTIPRSPLSHDLTGGGGPSRVHYPVFDDDAYCKHSSPPLISRLKVHGLCNTLNLFGGRFLCRRVCGREKDKCGGKKAPRRVEFFLPTPSIASLPLLGGDSLGLVNTQPQSFRMGVRLLGHHSGLYRQECILGCRRLRNLGSPFAPRRCPGRSRCRHRLGKFSYRSCLSPKTDVGLILYARIQCVNKKRPCGKGNNHRASEGSNYPV